MGIELFQDSDTSSADLSKIEIDEDFAKRLEHNKKREALQRCNELKKRGFISDSDDSEESSDESSREDAGMDDLQFYDALVRVKKNDSVILHKDVKLFSSSEDDEEEMEEEKPEATKKVKPLYLKDVIARQLLEHGPEVEDEPLKRNPKMYSSDQVEGLKAFLEAEKEAFGADDGDDVIIQQKRTSSEVAEEDETVVKIHQKVDEFFGEDGKLGEGDMFLKHYFLNKMWVDKEKDKKLDDDIGYSEDEDALEKQEKYECEFNFRHEEGQADRVLGHSRVTEGSVRKKNNSRTIQRKSKEERMAQAEFERKEELKHLKNLKKKEIQDKLERIRISAGIQEESTWNLDIAHIEEDFDPVEYDKAMEEMFGAHYYNAADVDPRFGSGDFDDLEKPDFDKEDKLLGFTEGWDSVDSVEGFEGVRKKPLKKGVEAEDSFNLEGKRKRKRNISLREKVELDKELEEYYKLDYEGTVGDLKTRFKYRSVPANSYGLQAEEILMANDKDLNQYVPLKKLAPYREKEWEVTYHQKLKKDVILHAVKTDDKISLKKNMKGGIKSVTDEDKSTESKRSRRRHKHAQLKLSKSRLLAYGKIPYKQHKNH